MKVTLDLGELLSKGDISQAEYDKLIRLSTTQTASLGFDILVAFGVIAVSGGLLALFPSAATSIVLGLVLSGVGLIPLGGGSQRWRVVGVILTVTGALLFGGGFVSITEGSVAGFLMVSAMYLVAGALARSGLLVSLAVLALSSSIGARSAYHGGGYYLGIREPMITVLLFSVIAIGAFWLSQRLPHAYARLALIASRTSVFVVNFGFWVGSLWGERTAEYELIISEHIFSVAWAVALLATGVWGCVRNRRWVVNTIAVFAAIHFYTQWFEHLGANAGTVVVAGCIALGGAFALRELNQRLVARH